MIGPFPPRGRAGVVGWLLEARDGDRLAICAVTYGDLRLRVAGLARRLEQVERGAVTVSAPRTVEGVVCLLGALAAGRTAVLVPPDPGDRLAAQIACEVRPIAHVRPGANGEEVEIDRAEEGAGGFVPELADTAVVIYTSGTTGTPKGVRLSERNLVANATAVSSFAGLRSDDVVSCVLPLHFSYGLSMLLIALRAGTRIVLHDDFLVPADCVRRMETERTTVFAGVPYHYEALLRASSGLRDARLSSLRLLLSAGGPMTVTIVDGLREQLPAAQLMIMYGQTEATARLSYLPPDQVDERPTSIGRGMPGSDLSVRDDLGRLIEPGQLGEVYARGESIMLGYLGDRAATKEALTPWGLRTRDLATLDEEGYIYLRGRTADYAKIRGVRVSLPEVEVAAEALPGVAEALAIAVTTDVGEQLVLEVRLEDEMDASAWPLLQGRIKRALPAGSRPDDIELVEQIARTASGKKIRHRRVTTAGQGAARLP